MFEKIIGNNHNKELLEKSIKKGNISHSYLFIGIQGIGKKTLATEFAKEILGAQKQEECENNNHPDFMCIKPEGNSIKIEQIRFLQKKIQEKPIVSDNKVYIIDDAEQMTQEAQNCLLKTLEEPPQFATIILIGSNENAFLPTIKSRCMILHFNPIENNQIKQYIEEKYNITNLTNNELEIFQGSIGKAIQLKDKKEIYNQIENLIDNLNKKDIIELINIAEPLYKLKEEIYEILEYINLKLYSKAKNNYLYTNCIKIVENTKKRIKQNANYEMSIDNMIFNIWEEFN